ncbi:MAG: Ca-activated chloride channel family protein [Patiriisocius sp.]|jgi:Ca-activated chloride channel family protein
MAKRFTYSLRQFVTVLLILEVVLWVCIFAFYFWVMPSVTGLVIQRPVFIWANLGLSIFTLIFILIYSWKNKSLNAFAQSNLLGEISPRISSNLAIIKYVILRFALLFVLVAIINPRYGSKELESKAEGIDIIIALDVSNSMLAEDIQPNRLGRAKMAIQQLLNNLHGDRLGLVIFAGDAYIQLPITTDFAAAKIFLADVDNNIIPVQGTAIGKAIDLCTEAFDENSVSGKTIIVITDGENHEDDAVEAAEAALDKGIQVYTIGMGSKNGAPIPEIKKGRKLGFKKDKDGSTVISKLNEQALADIAAAGNGKFTRATLSNVGLDDILSDMVGMEKNEFGTKQYADYEDRFQLFLLLAVLLLIVELIIPERKTRWSGKINLFEE